MQQKQGHSAGRKAGKSNELPGCMVDNRCKLVLKEQKVNGPRLIFKSVVPKKHSRFQE